MAPTHGVEAGFEAEEGEQQEEEYAEGPMDMPDGMLDGMPDEEHQEFEQQWNADAEDQMLQEECEEDLFENAAREFGFFEEEEDEEEEMQQHEEGVEEEPLENEPFEDGEAPFYPEEPLEEEEEPLGEEEPFDEEGPPEDGEFKDDDSQAVGEDEEEVEVDEDDAAIPKREDDLSLEDVPEDQREAVEGNLRLKRLLSKDEIVPDAIKKRRRVNSDGTMVPGGNLDNRKLDPSMTELLEKTNLIDDVACRYVIEAADRSEVTALLSGNWKPNRSDRKSGCEQLNDTLIRHQQKKCPPGGTVDIVAAFKHRWKLDTADEKMLRNLCHRDLRYVIQEYDGSRPLEELVNEGSTQIPNEDKADGVMPDKPGLFTMSRFSRLEIIDPNANALVIGDANLTFSTLLASHRESLGHVGHVVATTFETIETLRERYQEIDATIKALEDKSAEVLNNVDCTRLAVDPRFLGMSNFFGTAYYNFPHAGVVKGFFDGHPFVRWRHENLMWLFFRALRGFMIPGGLVKVSSNSSAQGVRYSDIISAAARSEFVHVETVPFLEWALHGYRRSYGDRRDANRRPEDGEIYRDQKAYSDMVYTFRYTPSGETPPKPRVRHPPTKSDLLNSHEGKLRELRGEAKRRKVEDMYQLFMSYVQGIHVG